jgi:uncharacterized membrane protein
MGAGWRLWRLSYLIAWLFRWPFVASLAWVLMTLVLFALTVMSVCSISFVELLMFLFGVFSGMCGESSCNVFFAALHHGSLGSYVRDAVQEGSADAVACLPVPRAQDFSSSFISLGGLCCFYL